MDALMNRRGFLALMLSYCGAALCSTNADCRPNRGQQAFDYYPLSSNSVWAWLRMDASGGDYYSPTSEVDYLANIHTIRAAMPLNAGTLQADGTWWQDSDRVNNSWAQALAVRARVFGQKYMPGTSNDRQGILQVLNNPSLQQIAAENLVALALEGRFDSPWDGVYFDIEGVPGSYRQQLSDFHYILAEKLANVGLFCGISVPGRTGDTGSDPSDAYTYDFAMVGDVADFVDLRCYSYWTPQPRSISPYWWVRACIAYAIDKGISPTKLTIGVANFSQYWPDSADNYNEEITYDQAMAVVDKAGAKVQWIEENENGLVREHYAKIGSGHVWIHDALTLTHLVALAEEYDTLGITLFIPGMGNDQQWTVLKRWVYPDRQHLPNVLTYATAQTVPPKSH